MRLFETVFFMLYRFLFWPFAITGIWLAKKYNAKLQKFYEQRRLLRPRDSMSLAFPKPPIWIHAASGEFEYAKPVIRRIKDENPSQPVFVTYFSPSYAESIIKTPGVDGSSPLPFDLPGPVRSFLDRLKPAALLIARTDVWPEIVTQTTSRNIPSLLFSATLKPHSQPRALYDKWIYSKLSQIYVLSQKDEQQSLRAGIRNVEVHGDTRFDQVIYRLEHPKPVASFARDERPVLIAGSTEPDDEAILLTAVQSLLKENKLRLIVAPHELNRLDPICAHLKKAQIEFALYSKLQEPQFSKQSETRAQAPVLLIDKVGILAELYTLADMAFVGGSFQRKVHSVMEPLAAGLPTIVGPHHSNNSEAIEFQTVMTPIGPAVRAVRNGEQLAAEIVSILTQKTAWDETKQIIRQEVRRRAGGTDAVINWLKSNIV